MSFPQIPFSMVRSRKVAIASSDLIRSDTLKTPVVVPKPASSDLVVTTNLSALTGDFYMASSDLQLAPPIFDTQGSVASGNPTNNKILAYWAFNSIENREYTTGFFDNFFIDSVGDPDLTYALNDLGASSVAFGLIGNALIPSGSPSLYANQIVTDPASNGFNFIGFGWWVKLTTTDFSSWSINESRDRLIYTSANQTLTATVTVPDPMNIGSVVLTYTFLQGSPRSVNISGSTLNDYHLLVCEIDINTGYMSLRLDTGLPNTDFCSTSPASPLLQVGDSSSNFGLQIDEAFMFKEPLTDIEVAAIYNSGAGQTYPFP